MGLGLLHFASAFQSGLLMLIYSTPAVLFFLILTSFFCCILHVEPEWLIFHQFFSAECHKDVLHLAFLELCCHWIVPNRWNWTSNGFMGSPSNRSKQLFATSLIYKKFIKYFHLHFKCYLLYNMSWIILIMYTPDLIQCLM